MTMNLYSVCDKHYEWCCYVFAPTRNRAKVLVAQHLFQDYIDLRSQCLKKGVNIPYCLVVDCPEDESYDLVLKCGYKYMTEEEAEYYDKIF